MATLIANITTTARRLLDRIVRPETRSNAYARLHAFATERPLLFTFLVAQILTSLLPVALFLAFTTSVLVLSVGCALLFSFFWLGVALLFLIPTLFVTVSFGFLVFAWALAARLAWAALPAGFKNALTRGAPATTAAGGAGSDSDSKDFDSDFNGVINIGGKKVELPRTPPYLMSGAIKTDKIIAENRNGKKIGEDGNGKKIDVKHEVNDDVKEVEASDGSEDGSAELVDNLEAADLSKFRDEKDGNITT